MKKISIIVILSLCLILALILPANAADSPKDVKFTVVFNNEELPKDVVSLIEEMGGKIVYSIPKIGVVQVQAPASFGIAALENASIQAATPSLPARIPTVNLQQVDTSSIMDSAELYNLYQWDIKRVTNDGASFELGTGSHDVVVGIIDSGVDTDHPDLEGNLLGGKNFVPAGGFSGRDLTETDDPDDIQDRYGHGTHVAGAIAGKGAILGVAPDVGFKAYRVFDALGGGDTAWVINALVAAADDQVDVISLSLEGIFTKGQVWFTDPATGEKIKLGNDVAEYLAFQRAAKYAHKKGSLIVAAAGNSALNGSNKKSIIDYANSLYGGFGYTFKGAGFIAPASFPNVIAVSATGPDDQLALYSNYGSGFIDVAAPGGDIRYFTEETGLAAGESCISSVPIIELLQNEEGNVSYVDHGPSYAFSVGTSMAAPKVSAVAALIISKYGKMKPSQLKKLIIQSTDDLGQTGYDAYYGHGLVNAYKALGGN